MTTATPTLDRVKDFMQECLPPETRQARTEKRKEQLARAETELANLLPVENSVRDLLQAHIQFLRCTITDPTLEERYHAISLEILAQRDEQGFPKLVPFALSNPTFSIEASISNWMARNEWKSSTVARDLPQEISVLYKDVFDKFWNEAEADKALKEFRPDLVWRKKIACQFKGAIPQHVRDQITAATPDFAIYHEWTETQKRGLFRTAKVKKSSLANTNIYLVAEADQWEVNKEIVPRPDPIIVGYKGGTFWLICSFDETPLEKYMREEFTI